MKYRISARLVGMVKYLTGKGDKLGAVKLMRGQSLAPDLRVCKEIVDAIQGHDYTVNDDGYEQCVVVNIADPKPHIPVNRMETIAPRYRKYAAVVLRSNGTIGMEYADTLTESWEMALEIENNLGKIVGLLRYDGCMYEPYDDPYEAKHTQGEVEWCIICGSCKCHGCQCI